MRWRQSRLGHLLALFAICLQFVAPILVAPQTSPAERDGFAELVRLHALCLGGTSGPEQPDAPAQDRSDHTGHHFGACCLLHGGARLFLAPPGVAQPAALEIFEVSFPAPATVDIAARPAAAPRARAPPSEA